MWGKRAFIHIHNVICFQNCIAMSMICCSIDHWMSILILSLQHLCSSQFISVFYTATEADSLQVWLYVMFDLFPCWKGWLISFQAPHSPTYLNNITNTLVQQKHRSNQLWILVMDPNLFIYHMWGIPSPLPKHVTFFWLLFHRHVWLWIPAPITRTTYEFK